MAEKQDPTKKIFEKDWEAGHTFDLKFIQEHLLPIINEMHERGEIGPVIADIGSGRLGVSSLLKYPDVKIIRVDLVAPTEEMQNTRQFPADLRNIQNPTFGEKRQLVKTKNWLEQFEQEPGEGAKIDTMILSCVLNYVDYQEVINALRSFLKDNGRMIIFNQPEKGRSTHGNLFSHNRPKNNYELIDFLKNSGLVAEKIEIDGVDLEYLWEAQKKGKTLKTVDNIIMGYLLYVGKKISKEANA